MTPSGRLKFLRNTDWRTMTLEIGIVFVGILTALQVDDWREERDYFAAETRYLARLSEDLDASIASSGDLLSFMEANYRGVRHVSESFTAGEILNDDSKLFEYGLIYVGHLPSVPIHRSAYDEMVGSGMFARLSSEKLKRVIAELYATQDLVERNFSWWREDVMRLSDRLVSQVIYYSEDEQVTTNGLLLNEPLRRIEFDFDKLRQDPVIRNQFYWATDTHSDWVSWTSTLLELAEEARTELKVVIAKREN